MAKNERDVSWHKFPSVMECLERWGTIKKGSPRSVVPNKLGVKIRKISANTSNHLRFSLDYVAKHPTDLIVIPYHPLPREDGYAHQHTAVPLSRKSGEITLFIPDDCRGFISSETGEASLSRILIPVDSEVDPQIAADAAMRVARMMNAENVHFHVVHVGESINTSEVNFWHDEGVEGWTCEQTLHEGDPAKAIDEVIKQTSPELVVMTTTIDHRDAHAVDGSVIEQIMQESRVPLLVVPGHIHLSP